MSKFVFSTDAELEPVRIEFADGARDLPAHILRAVDVKQLKDEAHLAALKTITWADFLATIEQEISRTALNDKFGAERMLEVNRKQARGY